MADDMKDEYEKPGWKTSEFWVMLCSVAFGIMILFGVITNTESNTILAYVNNIAGSLVTIVSVASYILSRGKAKQGRVNYTKLVADIERLVNSNNEKIENMFNTNNESIKSLIQDKMITKK